MGLLAGSRALRGDSVRRRHARRGATRRSSWATALCAGCLMIAFTAAVALRDAPPARASALAWTIGLLRRLGRRVRVSGRRARPVHLRPGARGDVRQRAAASPHTQAVAIRVVAGGAIAARDPARLQHRGVRVAVSPRLRERGRLRAAAHGPVRHLAPGMVAGPRNPHRQLPRSPADRAARGGDAHRPGRARRARAPRGARARRRGHRRLLPRAQRVVLLLGRRMGVRPAAGHARAAVSRARPGAALGRVDGRPAASCWRARWLWGAALTLVAVSTTPQPPASIMRPVSELMVPAFLEGHLALNTQRFTDFRADEDAIWRHADPTVSWNLGMAMGLTGRASLLPLGAVWLVCGIWLIWLVRATWRSAPAGRGSAGGRRLPAMQPASDARRSDACRGSGRLEVLPDGREERVGDQVVAGGRWMKTVAAEQRQLAVEGLIHVDERNALRRRQTPDADR